MIQIGGPLFEELPEPTLTGPKGRAWLVDKNLININQKIDPAKNCSVCVWIIEAEWAHPLWHSYVLTTIHLRNIPGIPEAAHYLEGATHEMVLHPLDPTVSRSTAIQGFGGAILVPPNFCAQFIEASDDLARERIKASVEEILRGGLSPDTDFVFQWKQRYGDNMVKDLYKRKTLQ